MLYYGKRNQKAQRGGHEVAHTMEARKPTNRLYSAGGQEAPAFTRVMKTVLVRAVAASRLSSAGGADPSRWSYRTGLPESHGDEKIY